MEINNLNSVNTVKSTVRKQAEKVQETGLKEDTFEKNVDIDTVMKTLDGINFSNGMKKFKYEVISNKIRYYAHDTNRNPMFPMSASGWASNFYRIKNRN